MPRDFEPLPYYRWYWRDARASRRWQRMTWEARAIYRELLEECWINGSIPDPESYKNFDKITEICGIPSSIVAEHWGHIKPMFTKKGRRLYHDRTEREREKAAELHAAKSDAGKRGAEKRWNGKDGRAMAEPRQAMASSSSTEQNKSSAVRRRASAQEAHAPTLVGGEMTFLEMAAAAGFPSDKIVS